MRSSRDGSCSRTTWFPVAWSSRTAGSRTSSPIPGTRHGPPDRSSPPASSTSTSTAGAATTAPAMRRPCRDGPSPASAGDHLLPAHGAIAARTRDPALRGPGARLDAVRAGRRGGAAGLQPGGAVHRSRPQGRPRSGAAAHAREHQPGRRGGLAGRAADHDDRPELPGALALISGWPASGSSRPSATPPPPWTRPGPATAPPGPAPRRRRPTCSTR